VTKHREVELKLELGAEGDALRKHELLADIPCSSKVQRTVYFDTPKGLLRSKGFSLRVRTVGGKWTQTVKQSVDEAAGLFDRSEWEAEIRPQPDLEAAGETPLLKAVGLKALRKVRPVVTSDVTRTTWILGAGGGEIELCLDEGSIGAPDRQSPIHELELELRQGDPLDLMKVARALAEQLPLKLGVLTKAERGFYIAQGKLDTAYKSDKVAIRTDMGVGESFAAIVHSCLKHFRLNEPLVLEKRDASALHQCRVAMRRLRSAFWLFAPYVEDEGTSRIRDELRWFASCFGQARNLDVLTKRLDEQLTPATRKSLSTARSSAYDDVEAVLAAPRSHLFMLDLVEWVEFGAWRESELARSGIKKVARQRLDARWKKVQRKGAALADLPEEARHRLRIDIKKLRYATEFLWSLYEKQDRERRAFASDLAKMQEDLGYLNDIATAGELIASLPELRDAQFAPSPDPKEARRHLKKAQKSHDRLVASGAYWR